MKGFVQKDCAFAGQSLGEYSALGSIADVLHISALVNVVFYRGITMCDGYRWRLWAMALAFMSTYKGEWDII